jgi:hypothetical protein
MDRRVLLGERKEMICQIAASTLSGSPALRREQIKLQVALINPLMRSVQACRDGKSRRRNGRSRFSRVGFTFRF